MAFNVPRKGRTCACCGKEIIVHGTDNQEYVRLHFSLKDSTAVAPISFCRTCAEQPWTDDRLASLDAQCQWMHEHSGNQKFSMPHIDKVDTAYPPQVWSDLDPLRVTL